MENEQKTEQESGQLAGKKILSVEDDTFLSDVIGKKLSAKGAKMKYAQNGEDALKMIEEEKPDVVLLDILLPGTDGFEVLEKIKASPSQKDIPVILFSNLSSKEDIEKGMKLGAARFLVKASVIPDEISGVISEVLNKVS